MTMSYSWIKSLINKLCSNPKMKEISSTESLIKKVSQKTLPSLNHIKIIGGDFSRANFSSAMINNTEFDGSELQGANFSEVTCVGSIFKQVNARGVQFFNSCLKRTSFNGSILVGTNFAQANLEGVDFSNCSLVGSNLASAKTLNKAIFNEYTQLPFETSDALKLGMIFRKSSGEGEIPVENSVKPNNVIEFKSNKNQIALKAKIKD